MIREGLMVAFFLAGLVVLGGQQKWWLQPLLADMGPTTLYFGATLLTAITDNAALTYLGSLVDGVSDAFKYSMVAGAVTGGGLTVIANAPNPAGYAILKDSFEDGVHRRARPARGSDAADARRHCSLPASPRVSTMVSLQIAHTRYRTADLGGRTRRS